MTARCSLLALALAAVAAPARADVKLHPIFTDHMVLQRGKPIRVFGTAAPGEKVNVSLVAPPADGGKVLSGAAADIKADAKGAWQAEFPAIDKAGTGYAIKVAPVVIVKGEPELGEGVTLADVAVGDVWICSGQSNMEWKLSQVTRDGEGKRVAAEAKNPNIRLFQVNKRTSTTPLSTFADGGAGKWLPCTTEAALNFSAVGYVFGRDIEASQKVPVGLISTNWGGTDIEAWTSREGFSADPSLKQHVDKFDAAAKASEKPEDDLGYLKAMAKYYADAVKAKEGGKPMPKQPAKPGINQNTPTALYNAMIAPLTKFPIKGAIWYQGENNSGRAKSYRVAYPAMITDWRKQWGYDFPFFGVQLAPFKGGGKADDVNWAELRDAQFHATKVLKDVGIAVITDVGDKTDIHPQRKIPVGERLALSARAIAYGEKVPYRGPTFKSKAVEGEKLVVTFEHAGKGLKVKGETLAGFQLCGEDKIWHPATAKVEGQTVVVTSDKVAKPVEVRFGWANYPEPELNLFNEDGLPAVPFRSDDFPMKTN